jgi:hypothetical protein
MGYHQALAPFYQAKYCSTNRVMKKKKMHKDKKSKQNKKLTDGTFHSPPTYSLHTPHPSIHMRLVMTHKKVNIPEICINAVFGNAV